MRPLALCTDSSAVPMSIAVDDLVFDEPDLDVDEFYAAIARGGRAATSQPSPGRFAEAYAAARARGAKSSRSTSAVRSREPWDRPR